MCEKKLNDIPNQKYKISLALKKVYDITERKVIIEFLLFQQMLYFIIMMIVCYPYISDKVKPVIFNTSI